MASPPRRSGRDPDSTNPRGQAAARPADDQATRTVEGMGAIAELRAALGMQGAAGAQTLPLYAMPDAIIVGRGTACDWQLDDTSLSRKHAQFRWNGRELTVEDLGSANGTRVNGRPARSPTPVRPADTVQLGTVIITLALTAPPPSPDEQATRMVAQPDGPPPDFTSDPGLAPLPAAPTVVRPQAPAPRAAPPPGDDADFLARPRQVFRPAKDFAGPDDPTHQWDARAVLVRAPDRALDDEFLERLRTLWQEKRRTLVLAGAAAWIAVLLIVWSAFEKPAVDEDALPPPAPSASRRQPATPGKPVVTQLGTPSASPAPHANAVVPDTHLTPQPQTPTPIPTPTAKTPDPSPGPTHETGDAPATGPTDPAGEDLHDDQLERAVAAYDQGRMQEALGLWRHLAADGKDATAKFMVELIESRLGSTP